MTNNVSGELGGTDKAIAVPQALKLIEGGGGRATEIRKPQVGMIQRGLQT
jgi:hypothetical protein